MTTAGLEIRNHRPEDESAIAEIFAQIVATADSYPFTPDTPATAAIDFWCRRVSACRVATIDGVVVGSAYIKPNLPGLASHVCNAGFMVAAEARGRGLGRRLCEDAMAEARRLGFRAMQFNAVVASNRTAVELWQRCGFSIIGTVPEGFAHGRHGWTDLHIMFRRL